MAELLPSGPGSAGRSPDLLMPDTAESYRKGIAIILGAFAFALAARWLYVMTIGSNDFADYQDLWYRMNGSSLLVSIVRERFELGSLFLIWALSHLVGATATIYTFGLTAFSIKSYLIRAHLDLPWLAWLVYMTLFMYIQDATQIRGALGACFVLYALLVDRSRVQLALLAAFGSLFHYSALIILALWFVDRPLVALGGIALTAMFWNAIISAYPTAFGLRYLSHGTGSVNMTNSNFLAQVVLCAIAAYEWPRLSASQRRGAYLIIVGAIMYVAFRDNAVIAHRFRELSLLGVLPLLFTGERRLSDAKILMLLCVSYISLYGTWFVITKYVL